MPEELCQGIYLQFTNPFDLLRNTIAQFTPDQWLQGDHKFEIPAKISYQILNTLDYYLRTNTDKKYAWGHHFGGGWWELADSNLPSPQDLLNYLDEITEQVEILFFHDLTDDDLYQPFDKQNEFGDTILENFIYAPWPHHAPSWRPFTAITPIRKLGRHLEITDKSRVFL